MDHKAKREYLSQYKDITHSIKIIESEIRTIKEYYYDLRNTPEYKLLMQHLEASKQKRVNKKNEIYSAIHNVTDERQRKILELHYMQGMSIERIADEMFYCKTTIDRAHKKAIDAIRIEG